MIFTSRKVKLGRFGRGCHGQSVNFSPDGACIIVYCWLMVVVVAVVVVVVAVVVVVVAVVVVVVAVVTIYYFPFLAILC